MPDPERSPTFKRSERLTTGTSVVLFAAAAGITASGAGPVTRFVTAGLALAALAAVIGQAIEHVGERLGAGATGLLQSTLGNLPEFFVSLFALHQGLVGVVQAALVGSVLGNAVLVLGCAFVVGGALHGNQRFDPEQPRLYSSLLLLVVAALLLPTLARKLQTPAAAHAGTLSDICAVVLLAVYLLSIPFWLRRTSGDPDHAQGSAHEGQTGSWPLWVSVVVLSLASAGAAITSDWFVEPLKAATESMGISEAFTGLVIVAIASNAVEHAVGVRFALKAKPDYAISTILSSPLQVALLLTPILVLVSPALGPAHLTLVFPPLLVAVLAISAVVVAAVVYDGEYTWMEGVALVGLYCITAASFWWG